MTQFSDFSPFDLTLAYRTTYISSVYLKLLDFLEEYKILNAIVCGINGSK